MATQASGLVGAHNVIVFAGKVGPAALVQETPHRWFARADLDPSWGICFFKLKTGGWAHALRSLVPPAVWDVLKDAPAVVHVLDIKTATALLARRNEGG